MGACTSSAAASAGGAAAGAPSNPPSAAAAAAAAARRFQLEARAIEDAGLGPAYPVTSGSGADADAWGDANGGRDRDGGRPQGAPHDGPALAVAVVQALPHVAGTTVVDAIAHRGAHAADDGTFRSVAAVMLQLFASRGPGDARLVAGGGGGALDDAAVAAMLRAFAAAALRRPGEPRDYSGAEAAAAVAPLRAQLDACVRQRVGAGRPPDGGGGGVTADDLETWLEKLDEESGDPTMVVAG
jgi:hypothetical protein